MNFLFVHQNFPGQYVHVVRHLAAAGHGIVALTQHRNAEIPGVRRLDYAPPRLKSMAHVYVRDIETAVLNGLAVARVCEGLKREGFVPDIMIGHNGWGETLYLKDVWPQVPLLAYFEFFYRASGSDVDFDAEFETRPDDAVRLRTRNAVNLMGIGAADWGQTPTHWQHRQYPKRWRDRISVIHEGVDTERARPDPSARVWLKSGASFSRDEEVITYVARNLEPYRGFHVFMRALPGILRRCPNAHVLIVGGDGVSYGRRAQGYPNWRAKMMAELGDRLDLRRVHFLGRVPYQHYLGILQISSAHIYLTYPFVLSWSMVEAMAAGVVMIGSRTPPVEEVIEDGENGHLVDFFDGEMMAERVAEVLRDRQANDRIRAAARDTALERYDLKGVCLPAYLSLVQDLVGSRIEGAPPRRRARSRSVPQMSEIAGQ
ncbi:MAG: glycosyltransferase family 4 protein [Alphaproteobacteria bacterium]|nr:glycosyltransferase family 4 protein [Alphaproteobacteria bacterium]